MIRRLDKSLSWVCIFLQLAGILTIEFDHHHVVPGGRNEVQFLSTHACTTVEHHPSLDAIAQCPACQRIMSGMAIVGDEMNSAERPSGMLPVELLFLPLAKQVLPSSPNRGPPLLPHLIRVSL